MKTSLLFLLAALSAASAPAQLAPPNEAGVAVGHIHLGVKDIPAQERFFTEMMGGVIVTKGAVRMIRFPGAYIMLRKADPTGPPAGSIVDHFGFVYKDLPAMLTRWKAAGVKIEQQTNPNQGYVTAPDDVRIEFFGDPSIPMPVRMDHIHFVTTDILGMREWYWRVFGGAPGVRAQVARPGVIICDYMPGGINLSFNETDVKLAPTKGRSLDHIGFDVESMDRFAKRIAELGIRFDVAPQQVHDSKTRVAFLTDPWGTYIEVTENFEP